MPGQPPFDKILIANRGEIAVRILRACQELGIATVAVYSDADRHAVHVRLADEAVYIGPSPPAQSYLAVERILQAALESHAQAVHPGYGFLSENPAFARAVQQAGLVFIGPPPAAIEAMGDKARARELMQRSGVPVIPGYQSEESVEDDHTLALMAQEMGYPVLVKAAAGGGGKGMRVVWKKDDMFEALESARREALQSFGDPRMILERYIPHARHIEFQVLGDHHGNMLHLCERECSLQRRHQKIVEETPSPYIDPEQRLQMGETAVAAARSVGYQNAGTVEFIVDPEHRKFYFLEMNTRLQVEHPVTELVTGLDLVQWQIRIAAGDMLLYRQDEVFQRGHALECRIYAEDPANQFLPASGPLLRFVEPTGPGVRVDSGFTSGDEIVLHYDPLVAKIITWGETRQNAIRRMQSALRQTVLLGVTNNNQFLQEVLAHPDFQDGNFSTSWIEENFEDWQPPDCFLPPEVLVAAALTQLRAGDNSIDAGGSTSSQDPYSPWRKPSGFRVGERRT